MTTAWPSDSDELLRDEARDAVGAGARRKRHDEADGLGRIGALRAGARRDSERDDAASDASARSERSMGVSGTRRTIVKDDGGA